MRNTMRNKTQIMRNKIVYKFWGITLLLILLAGMVQAQPISHCEIINNPGDYQLTQDIIGAGAPPNDTCIVIYASNVNFDGQGHTIDGSGAARNNTFGILVNNFSTNVNIANTTLTNWDYGILYEGSDNGNIINNNANSNNFGIALFAAANNLIKGNNASNNLDSGIFVGIVLNSSLKSSNDILEQNTINNNLNGVQLDTIGNTTLKNNVISKNAVGVSSFLSEGNTLDGNDIINSLNTSIIVFDSNSSTIKNNNISNGFFGIILQTSFGNTIYNNIFNNANNAVEINVGNNIWNISEILGTNIIGGPYLGGNFWSDYLGNDTSGDRIGDTLIPYNNAGKITGGDFLPLTMTLGVVQPISSGGTVTSDTAGIGTSPSNPVVTNVTSPGNVSGNVTIQISPTTGTAPTGFSFLGQQVDITTPSGASTTDPLTIVFTIDSSLIPAGQNQDTIQLFKNVNNNINIVPNCLGFTPDGVTPIPNDPCINARTTLSTGDVQISVLSSSNDPLWNFGISVSVPPELNVTKDFRSNVNLSANVLGTLLQQNGTKYNVSYILKSKDGTVTSTNPGSVFGVITINGTGTTNITINDNFNAASGPNQFIVSPPKIGGGVNIIRFNTTTNSFVDITNTSQIVSADINNTTGTINLTISLNSPLSNDEDIMVFGKFATALKGELPNFEDFINTAKVVTGIGIGIKDVSASINFVK